MVFHARKWGWKRIAANLLLVPVLTGASAAVAHAQYNPVPQQATPAAMPGKPGNEAKALLKEGRKALAAGQFDRAQDLARAANASNPGGKWGVFDDTPASLLKDVQAAVAKAQKAEAGELVKQAKMLLAKPAPGGEAERAANLDSALQLVQRAEQLHGPYSAWDLNDRADKLAKDIQAARGKLKNVPPATPAMPGMMGGGAIASTMPPSTKPKTEFLPAGSGVTPATGMTASRPAGQAAPVADAKKQTAIKLMAEGQKLAEQRQYAAARAKFVEADKVGAAFTANEYSPGFALNDLSARGHSDVETLLGESQKQMAKKDFVKAEASLDAAGKIASSLGLYARPIEDARGQLRAATSGKFGGSAPATGTASAPATSVVPAAPERVAPLTGPVADGSAPVKPISGTTPPGPKSVATAGGAVTPKQLLDQAAIEFKNGDMDVAAKLALQAHNLGAQEEARGLLNSIDAERLNQKKHTAVRSYDAAVTAFKNKDYNHALGVLVLVDINLLPDHLKQNRELLITKCREELEKAGQGTTVAAGAQLPALPTPPGATGEPPVSPGVPSFTAPGMQPPSNGLPPGTARVGNEPPKVDSVASQADALRKVQFQKLRSDGLKIQSDAAAAFGRGETDLAMQMLVDYANRVRASNLESASVALLLRPIESRLETFRVMKGQTDAMARLNRETREAKEQIAGRGAAEEQRKAEVTSLVRKYHQLVNQNKFAEAEKVAMQAKQLNPDDPAMEALAHMAKINRRVKEQEQNKADRENIFYGGLSEAEKVGPMVSIDNPVSVALDAARRAGRRGSGNDYHQRTRTPAEYEIELKLDKPISIEFSQTPLEQAVENLKTITKLPLVIDYASLDAEGLSAVKPVTVKPGSDVATRHILSFTLEQAGLSYVVENDLVKVTSTRKAKGRLFTKVFSVADLVTPIPNFAMPEYANYETMLKNARPVVGIGGSGATPINPQGGLTNGVPVGPQTGALATSPGISGGMQFGPGGKLQSEGWQTNPLGASVSLAGASNTKHEQLIKLITSMVRPLTWDGMGGAGKLEFFDIGSALVVNQTADVIREVEDLLEALRRLQDLALAVEIRIVSLSESWYERMGVDFSMNIKTHTANFEPSLAQIDTGNVTNPVGGVFRPTPFVNDINSKGVTVGLTPAGTFTPDLDVPIRPRTFEMAVPPFGGYPNSPGANGGISLGLAFLNDIQVYMFMEAAQGDRRINVMQAPKLTLFNGQTATINILDQQFFVANVTVVSVNGQLVFIPNNSPFPTQNTSYAIAIQGVVSADRRFVRLNLPITLSTQAGTAVPLFPFTTFVIPTFEGGSQGQPVPFTQFLQQPGTTTINVSTTVVCPDGGTVLLGGLKTLSEGRNEFGPPVLSKIPYLNRLFKNVGIGRETRHIMIMVTPRIIINSEEEIFQTEGRVPPPPQ